MNQLPWIPDEISKDESLLSSFGKHEKAYIDLDCMCACTSSSSIRMHADKIRWFGDCLKHPVVSSLSYANVACLVVSRSTGAGRA